MTWAKGGSRRRPLPRDWPKRRAAVLRRDPICKVCGERPSTEVDHIDPDGSDELENLQGICSQCHKAKTGREANAWRANGRRPAEPHPGVIDQPTGKPGKRSRTVRQARRGGG